MSKSNDSMHGTALRLYQEGYKPGEICEELEKESAGSEFSWRRVGTLVEVFKNGPRHERIFSFVER